jgi:hypothetical protein
VHAVDWARSLNPARNIYLPLVPRAYFSKVWTVWLCIHDVMVPLVVSQMLDLQPRNIQQRQRMNSTNTLHQNKAFDSLVQPVSPLLINDCCELMKLTLCKTDQFLRATINYARQRRVREYFHHAKARLRSHRLPRLHMHGREMSFFQRGVELPVTRQSS